MTFQKLFSTLALAGVCGFSASVANAEAVTVKAVTVTFDKNIFSGSGYDAVRTTRTNTSGKKVTQTPGAGRFQGTASNVVGVPESIFFSNLDDLFMYCYELEENIAGEDVVNYTIKLDGELDRTLVFLGAVNTVLSKGKPYDPYAWLRPLDGNQGAAIQLGIWESKYDTNGWDLKKGDFTADNLNQKHKEIAGTDDWWNLFKDAIDPKNALDGKYVMTFEAKGAQNMIAGDPPSEVPEPGSLALLGVALAGLAAARRHKSPAK